MNRQVILPDGTAVPALGQGTWMLGEQKESWQEELTTLKTGIECGMTVLDTAEMYGNGKSEELVGAAISGYDRDSLFLVSKVYPHNAGRQHIFKSCMASMERMKADYLDLYLLHWRGSVPLEETVECMQQLVREGKIRRWGVSNFDTDDMEELLQIPGGETCAVNQVLYHVASRGIEYNLLPLLRQHQIPIMAYSPLAHAGELKRGIYRNAVLTEIAAQHQATVTQIMLAFVMRERDMIAIPRTGKQNHMMDNYGSLKVSLTDQDIEQINREFPAPNRKVHLDIL